MNYPKILITSILTFLLAGCATMQPEGPLSAEVAAPHNTSWFVPGDNRVLGQQNLNYISPVFSQAQPAFVAPTAY